MQTQATLTRDVAAIGPWYGGVQRKHWTVLTASFLGWVFDGYESYALVVAMPFILGTMLAFLLSLATTTGWWAISSWLPAHVTAVAKAAGYASPADWGTRAALAYTVGAVCAYLLSGFAADAIGRRRYLFLTFLGCFAMTPVTYLWTRSLPALMGVAFVNGFFTLGCAYSWMAIYPVELFTSTVRSTAASFIFNAARLVAWVFPLAAGVLIQTFGGIPRAAMTLGVIYLLGLVVPWFLPETRGRPLPA